MKDIEKIGYTNPLNKHQSGLVVSRGGCYQANIRYNGKTHLKQLDILGAIGDNERVNRDSKRVINSKYAIYSLKAHIALEPPLIVKKRIVNETDTYGRRDG